MLVVAHSPCTSVIASVIFNICESVLCLSANRIQVYLLGLGFVLVARLVGLAFALAPGICFGQSALLVCYANYDNDWTCSLSCR